MSRSKVYAYRLLVLVGGLLFWQFCAGDLIAGVRLVDPFFISSPSRVVADLKNGFADGLLLRDVGVTVFEAFAGLAVGMVTGVAVGMAFGMWKPLEQVGEPFMAALNAMPRPAIAPLAVLWLGIGIASKILLAWSLVFFLVFYNTYLGVKTVDQDVVNAIRVMRARPAQLVRIVIFPSVFSWIFAAFRLSVSYALIGAIIGEFVGATGGLGYQLITAEGLLQTDRVYSALVLVGAIAVLLTSVAKLLEDRVLKWRPQVAV
ncbi:MAG: ABC transporter permease [Xanthobacteraceae bacterium]